MDPLGNTRVGDLGDVERQLGELWGAATTRGEAVVRACALNLVVACADGSEDVIEATRHVARLSESEPGRALVIAPTGRAGGLDVFVSAHCHRGPGGGQVCSEQLTLETGAEGRDLVPGTVLQLLVEEMPVCTWWRRPRLGADPLLAPLRDLSDWFIVDSSTFADPVACLKELSLLAPGPDRPGRTVDLTWIRTEAWRESIASFFDAVPMRAHLDRVSRVVIEAGGAAAASGVTAPAALLAGWLSSRLDWSRDDRGAGFKRPDGGRVEVAFHSASLMAPGQIGAVRLETEGLPQARAFVAERPDPDRELVLLRVEGHAAAPAPWALKLPTMDDAALLCGALQRSERDPIHEAAAGVAARLA